MMASSYNIPLWKSSPFVRLLLPLTGGIVFQWYAQVPPVFLVTSLLTAFFGYFIFKIIPIAYRYKFQWVQGIILNGIIFLFAVFLTSQKDIRNDANWFGSYYTDSSTLLLKINEPPTEKEKSFKAEAVVETIFINGKAQSVKGKLLIYFSKADSDAVPRYGDKIMISGGLQRIKNSGNPGAFNYNRYMAFQQTFHQAFLKKENYVLLKAHSENPLYTFIFWARGEVIKTLQRYVQGNKKVTGIAEALLIGYKEDLDKDVVQAYSNTGVVHIIAISGMHLGLIYVVLVWLFSRLPFIKRSEILRVVLILGCLWLFSLITGASASVLRSAVMFTCIVIGKNFFRQATIYNSLAASAFLLLCYDPYLLWDVGFQLSYCAVGGIVWLQKPIANLLYFQNKYVMRLWEMCALTLAAQVLTFPICIYYFHQLPATFLFTNLICVPLSTVILFAEIGLIILAPIPLLAGFAGKFIYVLTWFMNLIIDFFDKLPYSLADKIYATPFTTFLLYVFVISLCLGLISKNKIFLKGALASLLLFISVWSYGKIRFLKQKKIIIYNVSRHTAVDFIAGNKYFFYGDDELLADGALQNFNLKPARVSLQAEPTSDTLKALTHLGRLWQFYDKKILIIDSTVKFESAGKKLEVDVLLISHKPKINIQDITAAVNPAIIVIDGSNSMWKIGEWKTECEKLHLRCHITGEQGAYILNAD